MKARTILEAVLYMNDSESMGTLDCTYDDRTESQLLTDYFGIGNNSKVKGQFSKNLWFYSYNNELAWSDRGNRLDCGEELDPDVIISLDEDTTIYLYKIDD